MIILAHPIDFQAQAGRTTITVAHRLSTVRNADKIIVFNKGEIAESGTHDELMAANGIYKQLVQAQEIEKGDDEFIVGGAISARFPCL